MLALKSGPKGWTWDELWSFGPTHNIYLDLLIIYLFYYILSMFKILEVLGYWLVVGWLMQLQVK